MLEALTSAIHASCASTAGMASKYAFAPVLREVRFLFCQTSEQSASTRYEWSECRVLNV